MVDRMIQKAINNVLKERVEPYMHDNNFGFRSGRTTHDALRRAKEFLESGSNYIISLDIEKCFDNIPHGLLMEILNRYVDDKSIRVLLKRYIKQGIIRRGCNFRNRKGVIQGAPLSPLFANIYLNEFDWYMDSAISISWYEYVKASILYNQVVLKLLLNNAHIRDFSLHAVFKDKNMKEVYAPLVINTDQKMYVFEFIRGTSQGKKYLQKNILSGENIRS